MQTREQQGRQNRLGMAECTCTTGQPCALCSDERRYAPASQGLRDLFEGRGNNFGLHTFIA